jgi:hypothetical protein
MKKIYLLIAIILLGVPAQAQWQAEDILNAIVKVKSTIPNEARTARILGTTLEEAVSQLRFSTLFGFNREF